MNLAIPLVLFAAAAADNAAEQRARDVLARAREALGAQRPAALQSLSLEAELRRVQPLEGGETRDMSGDLTIDVQWPDRYLKIETLAPFPGGPAVSIGTGLDGTQAWRAPVGGGGPHMVVRIAEGEGPGAAEALLSRTRADLARLALVALAWSPGEGELAFVHAGEAEATEGRADLIDVSGPQGPIGRLFVDKATSRPLMLSFKAPAGRMQLMRAMRHEDAPRVPGSAGPAAPPPLAEARLYVSDWKSVEGRLLPHHVSQTIEGGASEEWTIQKWKLDPALTPGHFKKK